jgi:FkbM family methyltransferase
MLDASFRRKLIGAASRKIGDSALGYFPVRVRAGRAKGARWTLLPFSSYWRRGEVEDDVAAAAAYLPTLDGITFWDMGAHFGIHTVGMAMSVGHSGQVAAFEPDPVAFQRLAHHVRINSLSNVRIFNFAASQKCGTAELFLPEGHRGGALSHLRYHATDNMIGTASICAETVALDDLVKTGRIRQPDFIKVDIQGHGAEALAGSINSIKEKLPVIAFSSHSAAEIEGTMSLLEPLGYIPCLTNGSPCDWSVAAVLVPNRYAAGSLKKVL